jgi:hypothetical protein
MPEAVSPVVVSAAVEGDVDEAVLRKLVAYMGGQLGPVYGKEGKAALRQRLRGYNNAARHAPWVVLVDLDGDFVCAPLLRAAWLSTPARRLCFRVAVRQVEAWLLADAETIASFLSVSRGHVPLQPEALSNAKLAMVGLARRSRRRDIRTDMVPREGADRTVGPAYTSRIIEYAEQHWRPAVAAANASSLRRAMECVQRLVIGAST